MKEQEETSKVHSLPLMGQDERLELVRDHAQTLWDEWMTAIAAADLAEEAYTAAWAEYVKAECSINKEKEKEQLDDTR